MAKAINPGNGKIFATYDEMTPSVVSGIISDVHEAFLKWRHTSFEERAAMMREAARLLRGKAGSDASLARTRRISNAWGFTITLSTYRWIRSRSSMAVGCSAPLACRFLAALRQCVCLWLGETIKRLSRGIKDPKWLVVERRGPRLCHND